MRIYVDGKYHSFTDKDREVCLAKAIAFRSGLTGKQKNPQGMTLGDCVSQYINVRSNVLSPSTVLAYESYRQHRMQAYMDMPIGRFNRVLLQKMVNDEARYVSPKTVKNAWGLVSAALSEQGIDTSGINLPAIPRAERPWLTAEEIRLFCRAVQGKPCEIPALLALCSLRRSEICALTWKDVDLKKGTIQVRGAVVKGPDGFVTKKTNKTKASSRTVRIIVPQLLSLLRAQKDRTDKIVKGYPNSMYSQINKVCEDAGLPRVGVHGLRHSYASLCRFLRIPEEICARTGGWEDLNTMRKIYQHISEKEIADSEDELSQFFE